MFPLACTFYAKLAGYWLLLHPEPTKVLSTLHLRLAKKANKQLTVL